MSFEVEPLTSVVRVRLGEGDYGDPYDYACVVRYITPHVVELMAVGRQTLTPSIYRELYAAMQHLGVRKVEVTMNFRKHHIKVEY